MRPKFAQLLSGLDLTEIFKEKGHGDLKRWSARRTIGGVIVGTACAEIASSGITWEAVALCGIGILPLIISLKNEGRPNEGRPSS